jgi:phosphoglycerol transferase
MVARRSNKRLRAFALHAMALGLCLLVLAAVFDVRSEARRWPYAYRGDTMFYHLITKSVIDHGWFLDVPLLSAPGTLNLRDVPTSDNNLHLLILRLLALTTSHYPTVLNAFFLLTFPLVFVCSYWVFRHFAVGWWTSTCASLLYAFAPFHVIRGEHHLFLSAYWPIPLAVLMSLWVSTDSVWPADEGRAAWRSGKPWFSLLICLVLAATGAYYAFFACFFLLVASATAAARHKSWRRLWVGVALIAVICVGVGVNLWPSLLHFQRYGPVSIMQRPASDADLYGLRIAQLLLPAGGHRVEALDELKSEYTQRPLINENDHISLGFAGAAGFVGLLWWFFFRKPAAARLTERGTASLLHHLSIFNVAGVLFGTIGGFGSLVAFFGLPQIRAYNRISVFLSFFALFALALWLDAIARRYAVRRTRAVGFACVLAALTVSALLDQISPKTLPDYNTVKLQFASDAAFVRAIEQTVPRGALIFQLPFATFPESPPLVNMQDYDLLRGYLHSDHLRWSYGTIRGREENAWFRQTATLPTRQLVETLAWAGFSGISINRRGFSDNGAGVERELRDALGSLPIQSPDEELAFYGLRDYQRRLEDHTAPTQLAALREAAMYPPLAVWQDGFSDQEGGSGRLSRRGGHDARMTLVNRAADTQNVRLEMSVVPNDGTVTIHSALLDEPVQVDRDSPSVDRILRLPTGQHEIRFVSDAARGYPPSDLRQRGFTVENFRLTPTQGLIRDPDPSGERHSRVMTAGVP